MKKKEKGKNQFGGLSLKLDSKERELKRKPACLANSTYGSFKEDVTYPSTDDL